LEGEAVFFSYFDGIKAIETAEADQWSKQFWFYEYRL